MNQTELNQAMELIRTAGDARRMTRREALLKALGGSAAVIAGGVLLPALALPKRAEAQAVTDVDIVNFALMFEYLEAEYYTLGTTGQTIEALGVSTGDATGGINVRSNPRVNFATNSIRQQLEEIAADERTHVATLRSALGAAAAPRPAIDYTNAFNAAAQAAGIGSSFDPFADEVSFLLGGFVFSDVTVTALKGASPFVQSKDILDTAAGFLGVEGYHVGTLRTRIYQAGATAQANAGRISDARDTLDGGTDLDQPVVLNGSINVAATDTNSVVFSRSFSQVLHVAYLNPAAGVASGGFFPQGVNGTIRVAA